MENSELKTPDSTLYSKSDMFRDYPDCLNVLQLQQMLSIGRNRAYTLLKSGQIKHKRIGNIYHIPKPYVVEFILKNQ